MPLFDYKCEKCNEVQEFFLKNARKSVQCNCGGVAKRIYTVRAMALDTPIWSKAMGVAPEQIEEMNRIYPDHVYHPKTGDLRVMNARHRDKLAHQLGMSVLS